MKISFRIDDLELRNTSTMFEIVKWSNDKSCYTVAIFYFDSDGYPELRFVGDRPLQLENFDIFMTLVRQGYKFSKDEEGKVCLYETD